MKHNISSVYSEIDF